VNDLRTQPTRATYAGVFLIALSTLMYELLLTRIFSVTMWYHFAFVAVSMAMFGMTVGALVVFLFPRAFPADRVKERLSATAMASAVLMVLCFLTQLSIPFLVHPSIVGIYAMGFTYAVIALPFIAVGVCICLALTQFPKFVGQLYAADLCGAAIGCIALVYLLRLTDGPTAVIVVAGLAALAAWCFSVDAGARGLKRLSVLLVLVTAVTAAAHTVLVWRQFPVMRILFAKGSFEARPLYEKWNSYSRVRVIGDTEKPELPYARTLSPTYSNTKLVRELRMDIDVAASTAIMGFNGNLGDVDHLRYDVTAVGHYLRPAPSVLVVGTGGGRDILTALTFDAKKVTGVEINRDIVETLNGRFGEFSGHLDRDPRVRFVNDEARSFVARSQEQFDFIQISLIDTWAATAAGAFVLSENSVYTVEAWRVFLRHLTDGGVLSVSRWNIGAQPGEVYRLVTLASKSLEAIGVTDPRRHIVLIRTPVKSTDPSDVGVATLLVSRTPIADADMTRLDAEVARLQFEMALSPRAAVDPTMAQLAAGGDQRQLLDSLAFNVEAPTDNSPFFFQMLRFRDIFNLKLMDAGKSSPNLVAVLVLAVLLGTVIILSVLCIWLPLRVAGDRAALKGAGPLVAFFACIGLGFMLIETSQMQRLIIVLGHPTYGLSVVLFALLLAGGIGSQLTQHIAPDGVSKAGMTRLGALLVMLALFGLLTPWLTHRFEGATTPVRIAVAVALLFPPGLLMGMAFPLGIKAAGDRATQLAPWLWGINGALSVCASILAIVISLGITIAAAFWAGWIAYALALLAFHRSTRAARLG
jgi:SAM-dependent methyltransferase